MSYKLSDTEIEQFIKDGFVRVDQAFSVKIAGEVVDTLWQDVPFDRFDARTWTEPVVRLGMYTEKPFVESVNTPQLHAAFDQLIGPGRWIPCRSVGTFPVRFPSDKIPNDTGKHVDVSFPGDDPGNYFEWRANISSRGRALLMLVLYSDVSVKDAPTIIYKGSHRDVAQLLAPQGNAGLSFIQLAERIDKLPSYEEVPATGQAGTVYLCHPFLVHAAQAHTGDIPKFMAQPPLLLKNELNITGLEPEPTPVVQAIRLALAE